MDGEKDNLAWNNGRRLAYVERTSVFNRLAKRGSPSPHGEMERLFDPRQLSLNSMRMPALW